MWDGGPGGSTVPRSVEVHVANLVVAPSAVDRGAEASVPGLLQSGETVFEEPLKARLGGLQQGHVLQPAVNHWDACKGGKGTGLDPADKDGKPVSQVNPHSMLGFKVG